MTRLWLLLGVGCAPRLYSPDGGNGVWEPPENSWPVSAPPEDLTEEGFHEGEVLPDFLLPDQFGDSVSVWQFYGNVLVVDISTMWCGPCQELAQEAEATSQDYAPEGFTYLTVLPEDVEGQPPDQADLNTWVDAFDLTSPVVSDADKSYTAPAVPNGQYPVVLVVDREMRVATVVSPPTDQALREAIEAEL